MIKRLICTVLALGLVFTSTGCGEKEHSDKLVLVLRAGMYTEAIKEVLPDFEAEKGIACEIYELTEDELYTYVLNDSVMKNGAYDLCMVDGSWVAEFVAEEVLADIGELGCVIDDDIIPATASICVQNGKTYLMPFYGNVTVLMYNERVMEECGYTVEKLNTLDALLDFCQKSKSGNNGGFAFRGDSESNVVVDFLPILRAFGGWVVDENNWPTVNTEAFEKALNYYLELIATEQAHPKEKIIRGIGDGSICATMGWPGWYNGEVSSELEYTAFPGKVSEDDENHNCNIYGIWTLGIPENSTNKEMASELLKYLMDPEVQKSTVKNGGVPCRYSVLNDPELNEKDPHLGVICTALENGIYRPVMREWSRFYSILGEMLKKVIQKDLSVSEGLTVAQAELEELLKKK